MPRNRRHYQLRLVDVLAGHSEAIERFGGLQGIRDVTLIDSAIGRPYTGYYRSIEKKAAAVTESLVKNHGFVDGNKRTAVYAVFLLLRRSGYTLADSIERVVAPDGTTELEQMILDVATSRMTYADLVIWFKSRIVKDPG